MLTGKTYQEVADELTEHQWNHEGSSHHLLDTLLVGYGYAVARQWAGSRQDWRPEPMGPFPHLCAVDLWYQPHWVVMEPDGTVIDSARPGTFRLTDSEYTRVHHIAAVVPFR
jgi:hypothetical protein